MRPGHLGAKAIVALIAGLLMMSGQGTAQEDVRETTGSLPQEKSKSALEQHGVDQVEPREPSTGMILVSKRPIEVLARPSPSSVVIYGFPAGRSFRLVGHEGDFVQIQDLKSGAIGWIDEIALEQSPRVPAGPQPKAAPHYKAITASVEPKPKTRVPAVTRTHKATTASIEPKPKKAAASASRTHKPTTGSKATKRDVETSTPRTPKRRGIFGLRHNNAQGVLY